MNRSATSGPVTRRQLRQTSRRAFLQSAGISAAVLPLVSHLPSLARADDVARPRKQRLVIMFSPNGTLPDRFWPEEEGSEFTLKEILAPISPYQDRLLTLKGISNRVRGDGDSHMRGMSCLLTGIELFPGNIQGGSDTPAGWASGISIDQEITNHLQSNPATQTRFGSLEFGVTVPPRADPWTRMVYAGPNKPVAPLDDPYQVFQRMYGSMRDESTLRSVLDGVRQELQKVSLLVSADDRHLLREHAEFVRKMETELVETAARPRAYQPPEIEPGVRNDNDHMPQLSKMQIDLLVNSFMTDMARVATLQYTNSVGNARMRWLGIEEGHHSLSHDPDLNEESQAKLTKINVWFCEQLRYLVDRLAESPEPDGQGTMLDNTTVIWTNELGKGNSHTLNDIPFVLVGSGLGFAMGRSLKFDKVPHNRLLLSIAHAMGHRLEAFGNAQLCEGGKIDELFSGNRSRPGV